MAHSGLTSLYVGNLEANLTETQLFEAFNQSGQVYSVKVCRDLVTGRSLGYGYVGYGHPQDAERAIQNLNFMMLNGQLIRVMYCHRDKSIRKATSGKIFIKNLEKYIDDRALHDTLSAFGTIISCRLATDTSGRSKGVAFVHYEDEEAAKRAIEHLNGMLLNDEQVFVGPFIRRRERKSMVKETRFTNVYVKNLSEATGDDDLENVFGEFGTVTSAVVTRDKKGKSKCFGYVNFENPEDAARAVESFNGTKFDDKEWYVGKAKKKYEMKMEMKLRLRFEQSWKEAAERFQGSILYVKNLHGNITDDELKELFSPFGTVVSCKIMKEPSGYSRGAGYVTLSSPEEASQAMSEMNGKRVVGKLWKGTTIVDKPLSVAIHRFQQAVPMWQQQMLPYETAGMSLRTAPPPIGALAPGISNGTPEQQRTMLGESLYPLVERLEPEAAAKVTGMLLEMGQTEVLHLLESPLALHSKVAEAIQVLTTSVAAAPH